METLREAVDLKAALAKTKRLDLSFNELTDMYRDGELEIQPAFQRIFVWGLEKQSQFIESLLLELPVPPIYVVEQEEGKYILVDGLQRLSSYLHFRGELENEFREIEKGQSFQLDGCDIATELNNKGWNELDTALQIRLKRAFVSVQVIRRESDPDLKFHMFKRLNDGGTPLSRHQVRNCVVRMLKNGTTTMDFVDGLSKTPSYELCCSDALSDVQKNEQFDQELILRFFAMKNRLQDFKHDVGPFIDAFTEKISKEGGDAMSFSFEVEKEIFRKTFDVLSASTGELSFTYPNKASSALTRGFSVYHFEGVTLGLQKLLQKMDHKNQSQMALLKRALEHARLSDQFREVSSGGGRNSPGPLRTRINIIEEAVSKVLN
jgi:Protein of unknown function DUF262